MPIDNRPRWSQGDRWKSPTVAGGPARDGVRSSFRVSASRSLYRARESETLARAETSWYPFGVLITIALLMPNSARTLQKVSVRIADTRSEVRRTQEVIQHCRAHRRFAGELATVAALEGPPFSACRARSCSLASLNVQSAMSLWPSGGAVLDGKGEIVGLSLEVALGIDPKHETRNCRALPGLRENVVRQLFHHGVQRRRRGSSRRWTSRRSARMAATSDDPSCSSIRCRRPKGSRSRRLGRSWTIVCRDVDCDPRQCRV